mmetsp:Transcript_20983/g.32007  ORF Transcript_20983/g.32007 Transcript_20983/m.32007 type:complete len:356 (+) Transcript_20983:146-1213(+)|eukprot:CAMPEP_0196808884 /NCGR_PEP_ID=MMETSP1362-20130617/8874_1 /TAXON_ID=163516 /ORGANISM="Leptocylindrus danicus, Strain CCMP1856" /LENGTH=355 /DNA_ID=CAMNT_0042183387 /DNA_START=171 /DNA_END=1238 /DNA_ORIENTATION=+
MSDATSSDEADLVHKLKEQAVLATAINMKHETEEEEESATTFAVAKSHPFLNRQPSTFLRVHDLHAIPTHIKISSDDDSLTSLGLQYLIPNNNKKKSNKAADSLDNIVPLDGHTADVVCKSVCENLVQFALTCLFSSEEMWTADRKTAKICKNTAISPEWLLNLGHEEVLLWTGKFGNSAYYGSDLPCVKSRGLVSMSPYNLATLLLDSARVPTYNKNSLGRTDACTMQSGLHCESEAFGPGEIKIIKSVNKVPLVNVHLEFASMLHGRKIDDNSYIVVGRSIYEAAASPSDGKQYPSNEILLNVHWIQGIPGHPDKCDLVNLNHLKTSMVPMMLAKKIGLSSAVSFMNDIRGVC